MARMLLFLLICAPGCAQWSWMNQVGQSWSVEIIREINPREIDVNQVAMGEIDERFK